MKGQLRMLPACPTLSAPLLSKKLGLFSPPSLTFSPPRLSQPCMPSLPWTIVQNKWEWTYGFIKMIKLFLVLIVFGHWQACLWGLVSSYMKADGDTNNWVASFEQSFLEKHGVPPSPLDTYSAALYWSIMTLTSIGYGEMTPENTTERMLCSLYMMMSGITWTYAIGSVAAIATTLDPNTVQYENTMDQCVEGRSRAPNAARLPVPHTPACLLAAAIMRPLS
jgi:hypothetical protein